MQQDWSGSVGAVELKELGHWSRPRSEFAEPQSAALVVRDRHAVSDRRRLEQLPPSI
jgi:hypothetical protein